MAGDLNVNNPAIYSEQADWWKNNMDGGGPYTVWGSPKIEWYAVMDRNNVNVLTRGTGQVFTSKEVAHKLAAEWNA